MRLCALFCYVLCMCNVCSGKEHQLLLRAFTELQHTITEMKRSVDLQVSGALPN